MLFIENRISDQTIDGAGRIAVLEKLQDKGLVPLIRSARLHSFELALFGPERVRELERQLAARAETDGDTPYVSGDVFCFEDATLFLIFGDPREAGAGGLRAGIVYRDGAADPQQTLEAFCRNVQDALDATTRAGGNGASAEGNGAATGDEWQALEPRVSEGFKRFASAREGDASAPSHAGGRALTETERARIVRLLEEDETRSVLRQLIEARDDGRTVNLSQGGGGVEANEGLLDNLAGASLVKREVVVSCRKQGRALFRLPSMDAFQMVTSTNATCSECGTMLADERVEELVTPTELAATMLKEGSWMASRLRTLLQEELGLPESAIAIRAASVEGEAQMMSNVSGEPFLFYLRDGDVSAANARRALELQSETDAAHLVVIATGKIQDEGRVRLREHARRRAQRGSEVEVMLVEGIEGAGAELRHAFERVAQRTLAAELYPLDASLGLSVGQMIAARFRLMQKSGALRDLAASAAATLTGNLREF
ncbi:MAG TPA: hypothetical protein VNA19_11470 [Pyrinomonadaceae bacterium]|jgi:hypothetical protein|nr:hypothetical protein [Pyrinomonadaceae bacterium]